MSRVVRYEKICEEDGFALCSIVPRRTRPLILLDEEIPTIETIPPPLEPESSSDSLRSERIEKATKKGRERTKREAGTIEETQFVEEESGDLFFRLTPSEISRNPTYSHPSFVTPMGQYHHPMNFTRAHARPGQQEVEGHRETKEYREDEKQSERWSHSSRTFNVPSTTPRLNSQFMLQPKSKKNDTIYFQDTWQ